jgi:RNA polymerase subunit RPABC4/transcription elongation factor Spt4
MAFCAKCGTQMKEDAKFCPSCGAQAGGVAPATPATEKVGNIKKCPNCGAEVESFQTKCSACGFEFRDVGVSKNIQELFNKINNARNEQKAAMIKQTPIPNSKEMLLEFAILAYAQIDWDAEKIFTGLKQANVSYNMPFLGKMETGGESETITATRIQQGINTAWKSKIKEVWARAKISLADDRAALAQIETMVREVEASEKKAIWKEKQKLLLEELEKLEKQKK